MKQWLIIGAIVALLLGSYAWNRSRNAQSSTEAPLAVEEILTQADGSVVKKTGDKIEEVSEEEAKAKKQEITDKLADAKTAELKAVSGQNGQGTSARTFDNGTYYQKIAVTGMAPLQKGYYYEGWLQKEDGSQTSIGRIEMNGSQGTLLYSSKDDKTTYANVVVTRQVESTKQEMGEKVLEGNAGGQ